MYDLATDPQERINLAWDGHTRTPQQQARCLPICSFSSCVLSLFFNPTNCRHNHTEPKKIKLRNQKIKHSQAACTCVYLSQQQRALCV